jgi:hypothetical protein
MNNHKYRFGVNGNYLRTLFPRKIKKEKRYFPPKYYDTKAYVIEYFKINSFIGLSEVSYGFFTA